LARRLLWWRLRLARRLLRSVRLAGGGAARRLGAASGVGERAAGD